jgi:hypothetical protein
MSESNALFSMSDSRYRLIVEKKEARARLVRSISLKHRHTEATEEGGGLWVLYDYGLYDSAFPDVKWVAKERIELD